MTARPLTRLEWQRMRFGAAYPNAHDSQAHVAFDAAGADRIEATIEAGGFQPDPPTPYELDEWAARKIMGWSASAATWAKPADTIAGFQNVINKRDWKPSVDLGQALECVKQAGHTCQGVVTKQNTLVAYVDGLPVCQDASNTAELAEAIVRKLHAEVQP